MEQFGWLGLGLQNCCTCKDGEFSMLDVLLPVLIYGRLGLLFPLSHNSCCEQVRLTIPWTSTPTLNLSCGCFPLSGDFKSIVHNYCTVLIDLSPLCDCDTPDEIFILSPYIEGRDRVWISSAVALHLDILVLLWAGLA